MMELCKENGWVCYNHRNIFNFDKLSLHIKCAYSILLSSEEEMVLPE